MTIADCETESGGEVEELPVAQALLKQFHHILFHFMRQCWRTQRNVFCCCIVLEALVQQWDEQTSSQPASGSVCLTHHVFYLSQDWGRAMQHLGPGTN